MAQRLSITLPDDLYESIKKLAEENIRSISAQIAYMIKNAPTPSDYPSHPDHPYTGIRTPGIPENPEGRPTLTNNISSYYNNSHRKSIIN